MNLAEYQAKYNVPGLGQDLYDQVPVADVRDIIMREDISRYLAMEALKRLQLESWRETHGQNVYLIDTWTNRGCRVTFLWDGVYRIKISSRTGDALEEHLRTEVPGLLANNVIID